jgi:hypothetical protein
VAPAAARDCGSDELAHFSYHALVAAAPFVPDEFAVPAGTRSELFTIEPLRLEHNESDYAAWSSSREHIKATPGFVGDETWVDLDLSLADNADAIGRHEKDFQDRGGFAYTVLDPADREVIGSVYVYPPRRDGHDADVRSWVRSDRAALDEPLHDLVRAWLAEAWPFRRPEYAER